MRVEQKWGFGMAPVKSEVQAAREVAIREVAELFSGLPTPLTTDRLLDHISMVKGLFTRCWKQDQWDWFTVWQQLGRPGRKQAQTATRQLTDLRSAVTANDMDLMRQSVLKAYQADLPQILMRFPASRSLSGGNVGYIYVLSTRENRIVLKVGYTNRAVEERVKEINSSTGIVIPYGVRALWAVTDAKDVEADLHQLLAEYRIRRDREFFELDFKDAFYLIREYVYTRRAEL